RPADRHHRHVAGDLVGGGGLSVPAGGELFDRLAAPLSGASWRDADGRGALERLGRSVAYPRDARMPGEGAALFAAARSGAARRTGCRGRAAVTRPNLRGHGGHLPCLTRAFSSWMTTPGCWSSSGRSSPTPSPTAPSRPARRRATRSHGSTTGSLTFC